MKTIGFIDYYLSEWHANSYPGWFKQVCENTGLSYKTAYAYAQKDVSPVDGVTTAAWCEKYGVTNCESIRELCEKSDFVIILAPSNPETHLDICKEAFKYLQNRRVYIDKTFAPDLTVAKQIFALAKENNVKFFSTSALRYCADFKDLKGVKSISTSYGGSNLNEYIIHQVESIIKVMSDTAEKSENGAKFKAEKLKAEKINDEIKYEVVFSDGRSAFMNFKTDFGYSAKIEFLNGEVIEKPLQGGHFLTLSEKILRFFEGENPDFCGDETLEVMAVRDKAIEAQNKLSVWLKI